MVSQIFKKDIPIKLFINFIDKICDKKDNTYLLNKSSFKKAEFHNLLGAFLQELLEYYHNSKHFYITRKLNYNYFLTIIRQICSNLNIKYESKISYIRSVYHTSYIIYVDIDNDIDIDNQ